MTTPKAKLAGLALIAALCAGVTLGLTACTDERARTGAETPPAEGDFNAGLAAYKQGDYATAVRELRPLAKQGYAKAQTILGFMYERGLGVAQDDAEAVGWYRKAAEQGHARAQTNLGFMYERNLGVTQDDAEAVKWYRKAAEKGYARAQSNLGFMYRKGRGVPQDDAEAVKWYRKAAEQGFARAQSNLGFMYRKGRGVPQDDAEAVKWYRKAAEKGYEKHKSADSPDFKVFAYDPKTGKWGRSYGQLTLERSIKVAIRYCGKTGAKCEVYALGDTIVMGMSPEQLAAASQRYQTRILGTSDRSLKGKPLTSDQLKSYLSGSTFKGRTITWLGYVLRLDADGTKHIELHDTERNRVGNLRRTNEGRWTIKDNKYCSWYRDWFDGKTICMDVVKDGETFKFYFEGKLRSQAIIVKGE